MANPTDNDLQLRKWNASTGAWEDVNLADITDGTVGFDSVSNIVVRTPNEQRTATRSEKAGNAVAMALALG